MHLTKYYLDLVTDSGEAFVWHWASLRVCGLVRLGHVSELAWRRRDRGDATASVCEQRWSGRAGPAPLADGSARIKPGTPRSRPAILTWSCPSLNLEGRWTCLIAGPTLDLLPESPGAILWSCLHAASDVEVRRGDEVLQGHGYAERLDLALPPWRLPIETLRWGRLVAGPGGGFDHGDFSAPPSRPHSVVWIGWEGPRRQRIVVEDGKVVPSADVAAIEDDHVAWASGHLDLKAPGSLRDQPLCHALRGGLRWLGRALPSRLRDAREHRWLSAATFRRRSADNSPPCAAARRHAADGWTMHGLAMHERVQFGAFA